MSFYQYFKENFEQSKPLKSTQLIPSGTRLSIHAKHDTGPIKLLVTLDEDLTVEQVIDQLKQDDPSIITAVVYQVQDQQDLAMESECKCKHPTKSKRGPCKCQQQEMTVEQDEQMATPNQQQQPTVDPAKQQQIANIDKMIAQRQAQMASLRQNAERAQQQVQAKQREIDQLMRQKGAIS